MCWLRIWNAGATREGLKTESSTQRPDKLDEVKSRQKETDQSCWLHLWLTIHFSRVLFQWWGLRLFSDTDGQMRRSIKWRDLLRSNNIATSNQRFSLDSTAVSTFVIMLVELTNTAFVNTTNISTNIETEVLSKYYLRCRFPHGLLSFSSFFVGFCRRSGWIFFFVHGRHKLINFNTALFLLDLFFWFKHVRWQRSPQMTDIAPRLTFLVHAFDHILE